MREIYLVCEQMLHTENAYKWVCMFNRCGMRNTHLIKCKYYTNDDELPYLCNSHFVSSFTSEYYCFMINYQIGPAYHLRGYCTPNQKLAYCALKSQNNQRFLDK